MHSMWKIVTLTIMFLPAVSLSQSSVDIDLANEYYINGDYEKAGDIYAMLAKNARNIPAIHSKYFTILLSLIIFFNLALHEQRKVMGGTMGWEFPLV